MAILNNNQIGGASGQGGGYTLDNSLRFRASASAYLSRTPASAGDRKTWTWSAWVKRGNLGSYYNLMAAGPTATTRNGIIFWNTNTLRFFNQAGFSVETTQLFRDTSAWYHIIVAVDTTQATASNRVKVYINGEQVTSFSIATYPTLNEDTLFNSVTPHKVGQDAWGSDSLDGYLAEVNFIDGQALTAADFGETNEDTGVWQPIEYAGTYGTNGFYLKGRGTDNSGNSNDWTENNFNTSDSTLTTYDIMSDVPTLTDEDTSNFATLNPLNVSSDLSITQANLLVSKSTNAGRAIFGTIAASSGKVYWEVLWNSVGANDAANTGISIPSFSNTGGVGGAGSIAYLQDGRNSRRFSFCLW